MLPLIARLWAQRWVLRSLLTSICFNFYYLPWRQAIRLPILLYKPRFAACRGQVKVKAQKLCFGMIQLGRPMVPIYPKSGIVFENRGGCICFEGACLIGSNSAISVGRGAQLVFKDDFVASASLKIVACKSVTFGRHCRFGWDGLVMDTNFHPLYDMKSGVFKPAFGAVEFGDYNWIANQCAVMHGVRTPERCIVGMRSVVTRGACLEAYALHGGSPLRVLKRGVMRDYAHDSIFSYE